MKEGSCMFLLVFFLFCFKFNNHKTAFKQPYTQTFIQFAYSADTQIVISISRINITPQFTCLVETGKKLQNNNNNNNQKVAHFQLSKKKKVDAHFQLSKKFQKDL